MVVCCLGQSVALAFFAATTLAIVSGDNDNCSTVEPG